MTRQSTFVLAKLASDGDPTVNFEKAKRAVAEANEKYKPDLMVFPECFMSYFSDHPPREVSLATAQHLDGTFVTGMRELARQYGHWIIFGMNEAVEDPEDDRNYNTIVVVDDSGEIVSCYRKTHLYDAFGYKESDNMKPGDKFFEPIDTPFGRIGLFVCYEVRFPEVARYQRSRGADIIIMPTAWVRGDLKSQHFNTLIAARAIENTVYMVACDNCGPMFIGESVVMDPMGVTIAAAGEEEGLMCAHIDLDRVERVRAKLPAYKDRRPELYTI